MSCHCVPTDVFCHLNSDSSTKSYFAAATRKFLRFPKMVPSSDKLAVVERLHPRWAACFWWNLLYWICLIFSAMSYTLFFLHLQKGNDSAAVRKKQWPWVFCGYVVGLILWSHGWIIISSFEMYIVVLNQRWSCCAVFINKEGQTVRKSMCALSPTLSTP